MGNINKVKIANFVIAESTYNKIKALLPYCVTVFSILSGILKVYEYNALFLFSALLAIVLLLFLIASIFIVPKQVRARGFFDID